MKKNKLPTKPPTEPKKNIQYDLFSRFFGDKESSTNAIELWDSLPKYCISRDAQNKRRNAEGRLPVLEQDFLYRDSPCRLVIQPASIKQKNGLYKDFYPSASEELIEDVLMKIFTDQAYGIHDPDNSESWVTFSLQMIKKELKAKSCTRSLDQIKESLEILQTSVLRFDVKGERIYGSPILPTVTKVSRGNYLDDGSSRWAVLIAPIVSKSINAMSYQQINYDKLMSLKNPIAKSLYRRISTRFTQADYDNHYRFLLSSFRRDTGLLQRERMSSNVAAFEKGLAELLDNKVIVRFEKDERRGPRNSLADILYRLYFHPDHIQEALSANARASDNLNKLGLSEDKGKIEE